MAGDLIGHIRKLLLSDRSTLLCSRTACRQTLAGNLCIWIQAGRWGCRNGQTLAQAEMDLVLVEMDLVLVEMDLVLVEMDLQNTMYRRSFLRNGPEN